MTHAAMANHENGPHTIGYEALREGWELTK